MGRFYQVIEKWVFFKLLLQFNQTHLSKKHTYVIEYQLKASGKHDLTTVGIEIWATELFLI
jgi:hypothetical protein